MSMLSRKKVNGHIWVIEDNPIWQGEIVGKKGTKMKVFIPKTRVENVSLRELLDEGIYD